MFRIFPHALFFYKILGKFWKMEFFPDEGPRNILMGEHSQLRVYAH
jgi:hypothetical protein